ncbi:hypothetical protein [Nostoc sp.]|uniref:hypothetical protein n=1 Tax=Nostoc sp. TaxID=1180 RepID=UPI002FF96A83
MSEQELKQFDEEIKSAKENFVLKIFFFFLISTTFVLGLVALISKNMIPQAALTLLAGSIFSWVFVKEIINSWVDNTIEKIKKAFQNKYNEYENKPKMDFLSLIGEEEDINRIQWTGEIKIDHLSSAEKFKEKVDENKVEIYASHEAVELLLYSYTTNKGGKKIIFLNAVVKETINFLGNGKYKNISHEEFNSKSRHLHAYLRAWLICSIKHRTENLPIDFIEDIANNALTKKELIEAIKFIRTKFFSPDESILKKWSYTHHEDSRKMIVKYLDKLMIKINASSDR